MESPKLRRNGVTEFEMKQIEQDFDFDYPVKKTSVDAMDGTTRTDYSYYKYSFSVPYSAITVTEYNNLIAFLNTATENSEIVEFQFEKVSQYSDWVEVEVEVQKGAKFVGGSGTTDYYHETTVVIKEVNPR
jgi:hypothetical protein